MKYVIYEIWTRATIVEAPSLLHAFEIHVVKPVKGMELSNWHAVPTEKKTVGLQRKLVLVEDSQPKTRRRKNAPQHKSAPYA